MPITEADIDSFGQYAKKQLHVGADQSLEKLLADWVAAREAEEVADDIQQGMLDIAAGNGRPIEEAFQNVRRTLRLSE